MNVLLKKTLFTGILGMMVFSISAQEEYNPVRTAVPSLIIAPDARAGAMGDAGVATSPDIYSQHWNPAKYAFARTKGGVGLTYTPWLRKLIDDIALGYVSGYYKLGNDEEQIQALSASLRYFSIGEVLINDQFGKELGHVSPYELAIDLGYSRKLTSTFSGAVTVRYINVDYSKNIIDGEKSSGGTFAADIAGYNESYIDVGNSESMLNLGFNISNIGGKISTDGSNSHFIPTNLRLGGSYMHRFDEVNSLTTSLDLNKLLVPTPPVKGNKPDSIYEADKKSYNNTGSIAGIFKSFGDAPGGLSEEMKEISWSLGLEYAYDQKFKVRTGYFHETKMKGNRRYFTFGAGVRWNSLVIDAAYLLSTAQTNPLDQTLRVAVAYEFK